MRAARGWLKAAAAASVALAVGPQTPGCARGDGARSVAGARGDGRDGTVGRHGRGGSAGRDGPDGVDGPGGVGGVGLDELDGAATWRPTPLAGYRADFDLRWRGHLAGRAREELTAGIGGSGYRFSRAESWRVARGGSRLEWETEIVVDADRELRGERVSLYRDRRLRGSARRARGGWIIEVPGEGVRSAPAAAEPVELVPLRLAMRREARWAGPVLLAGFEFAVARLAVEPDAEAPGSSARRRRVVLSGPAGRIESRVQLRADGTVDSEAGPDASQTRVSGADPRDVPGAPPPDEAPPDLVALGAIPVSGRPSRGRGRGSRVAIAIEPERGAAGARPLALAPPPDLPGQRVRATPAGWFVELGVPAPAAQRAAAPRPPAPRPVPPGPGTASAWPPPAIPDPAPDPALRALADRVAARAGAAPLDQLRALARYTAASIDADLSRGAVTAAGEVVAAGRADCVGHAALFSALARVRGFDLRLLTGYRLDGGVLARHMWAVVAVGGALVAIDPSRGEAPAAPGRLFGLAVHGSAPAEIALAAELAFAGLSGARARFAAE